MTDFGRAFIESGGRPIQHEGLLVHMTYRMVALPAGVLSFALKPTGELVQGLGISVEGGWLQCNGEKAKRFALWCETAPDDLAVEVRPLRGRAAASVQVWNIWRHPRWGSAMAWVSAAGMLVEDATDLGAVLHASAGPGGPSFGDLRIEVRFRAA